MSGEGVAVVTVALWIVAGVLAAMLGLAERREFR
jgi:hypothetical protein